MQFPVHSIKAIKYPKYLTTWYRFYALIHRTSLTRKPRRHLITKWIPADTDYMA